MAVNPLRDRADVVLRIKRHHQFEVQEQAARVEIERAAKRQRIVNHHHLGMDHGSAQPHLAASGHQVTQRPGACDVRQPVVGTCGHDQFHLHAAPRRQAQGGQQTVVGYEVGRDGDDAMLGAEQGGEQQAIKRVLGLVRAAGYHLRAVRAAALCAGVRGQRHDRAWHLARGDTRLTAAPMALEQALRVECERAFERKTKVDPGRCAALTYEIFRREVASARP